MIAFPPPSPAQLKHYATAALLTLTSSSTPFHARAALPPASAIPVEAPAVPQSAATAGSIFRGDGYTPLTSGGRAGQVGDIITIVLIERTSATKSNSATTGKNGSVGVTPPPTGPLAFFQSSDLNMGGTQSFKGKGEAAQSNALTGELSVTVTQVYPNGVLRVSGEKLLTLNRGDERVQITGLVRTIDIMPDNRVASTRVADAVIRYVGKGEIARASRQGWLQRFFSAISPF